MNRLVLITIIIHLFTNTIPCQSYELEKLPAEINSQFDEITPVVSRNGSQLFFTRIGCSNFEQYFKMDGKEYGAHNLEDFEHRLRGIYYELGETEYLENVAQSNFNQDIWIATFSENGAIQKIEHPKVPLNNAFPNSIVSLTSDPNTFCIVNQFPENGGIEKGFSLIQHSSDGFWQAPQAIVIEEFYTLTSDISLTMSADGNVLILAAERYDSEGMDLYVCFKKGNSWSSPINLGKTINSKYREISPHLSEDNKTLYFSSNRNGNHDIYMARRLDGSWQNWTIPEALSAPINSWADDGQPYFNMTTGYLYFSSKRSGNSDIYRIQIAPPQPTEVNIRGKIIHSKTGELLSNAILKYQTGNGITNYLQEENGYFQIAVARDASFKVECGKHGFKSKVENVALQNYFESNIQVDILLEPLEVNSIIDLDPVFFAKSKPIILEKSYPALEKLATFLKENPSITIRIEGHTDNVGRETDLIRLSEQRAAAIQHFLTEARIQKSRIEIIGFGSKYPLNDNSSEELKRNNRRVEIRIIKN